MVPLSLSLSLSLSQTHNTDKIKNKNKKNRKFKEIKDSKEYIDKKMLGIMGNNNRDLGGTL